MQIFDRPDLQSGNVAVRLGRHQRQQRRNPAGPGCPDFGRGRPAEGADPSGTGVRRTSGERLPGAAGQPVCQGPGETVAEPATARPEKRSVPVQRPDSEQDAFRQGFGLQSVSGKGGGRGADRCRSVYGCGLEIYED
ncbi:hypothetical protein SDC9_207437 [bioreactor metagenome]|uniref:Uncharacterized protein n=1 Tax=bioreactor metagenome TaxID=1076179 RepID=A0A645J7N4_9ZZZZ